MPEYFQANSTNCSNAITSNPLIYIDTLGDPLSVTIANNQTHYNISVTNSYQATNNTDYRMSLYFTNSYRNQSYNSTTSFERYCELDSIMTT